MRWLVVALIFVVIFGVFTTVYAAAAKRNEVRVLPKWLWVLMCAFLPLAGGLLYLTLGRPLGPATAKRGPQTKVVAPDDDPNFLRDLKRRLDEDNSAAEQEPVSEDTPEAAPDADSTDNPEGDSPEAGTDKS